MTGMNKDEMMTMFASLSKRITALEMAQGQAGTGVCICDHSPQKMQQASEQHYPDIKEHVNLILDHRCPHHGVMAQPALWGREKGKVLTCKWSVWESIGVKR